MANKLSTVLNLISSFFYERNDETVEYPKDEPYSDYVKSQDRICESMKKTTQNPLINIILLNFKKGDRETIDSILNQSYTNWELYIPVCEYVYADERIHSIGDMTKEQLNEIMYGDYVLYLLSGDRLRNYCLSVFASEYKQSEKADVYYANSDVLQGENLFLPYLKPVVSPFTLLSVNYVDSPLFVSLNLYRKIGGIKSFDAKNYYSYVLDVFTSTDRIKRIDKILLTKSRVNPNESSLQVLNTYLKENCTEGYAVGGLYKGSYRVHYHVKEKKRVQIIAYNAKSAEMLRDWVEYTMDITVNPKIIYAAKDDDDYNLKRYETALENSQTANVLRFDGSIGFARMMNECVKKCYCDAYVFCNCECIPVLPDWIDAMYELAQNERAGTVSPLILSPDNKITGAGNVAGLNGTWGVPYLGCVRNFSDVRMNFYINTIRDISVADMNVFMISEGAFSAMRGFDTSFCGRAAIADLSIRLLRAGYSNIYTPFSCLQGIPTDFINPTEKDEVRTYDIMRDMLKNGDPYFGSGYDLSSNIPRIKGTNFQRTTNSRQ